MIREKDGGLFTNSLEDWSKLWVDHHPYLGIDPHRRETTTIDWYSQPMTATEIQRQAKKEIETITGFKIGDRVESVDAYRFGTVTDLTYERKIDDEIYIMNVVWDDGMASEFFLPTNEIIKVKKGEEKMIKVGDLVTVRCGKDTTSRYGITPQMKEMERMNTGYTVSDIRNGILVEVKGSDTGLWNFHINDVKLFNKGEEKMKKETTKSNERFGFNHKYYRVMFNGPATILFVDGLYTSPEKYITKAYNENFDEEKGLALALLKSFGISYLDFKRILATAKRQEKKVEEKKEEPKAEVKETPNKIRVNGVDFTVGSHAPIYTVEPTRSTEKSKYTVHQNKKKGKSYRFKKGDKCMVRLCKSYDFESVEDVRPLIGKPYGVVYVKNGRVNVNGLNFSPSELDRID